MHALHAAADGCRGACMPRAQNQMMADVIGHLRAISGQQSRIRGLRNKLAILREAASKQDGATRELLLVRRIPAVYRQCLAECMRRCAAGAPPPSRLPACALGASYAAIEMDKPVAGRHATCNNVGSITNS
jgi:hypothetical protein